MSDIELVIKIPEEMYKNIQSENFWLDSGLTLSNAYDFIRNGTPLPKGHDCPYCNVKIVEKAPNPVEPQAKSYRKFEEIVIDYPPAELCTYPEYRDKPYFSIKYEENGEHIIGFGTYKPEVLSRYIREYFIAESEEQDT